MSGTATQLTRGTSGRFVTSDPAPYPGPLKVKSSGPAVDAVQQALHTWGAHRLKTHPNEKLIRKTGATGYFGKATGLECGHAESVFHLPITNSFGPNLHNHFAPYYSDYSKSLLLELHHRKLVAEFRNEIVLLGHTTAGYELDHTRRPNWRYTQGVDRMSPSHLDLFTAEYVSADCSSDTGWSIIQCARKVGLPDPAWAALWFTTYNLIGFGSAVAIADIEPGDRVHYANNSHVGFYIGKIQGLPAVSSFGAPGGPKPRLLTYRSITAIRRDYP